MPTKATLHARFEPMAWALGRGKQTPLQQSNNKDAKDWSKNCTSTKAYPRTDGMAEGKFLECTVNFMKPPRVGYSPILDGASQSNYR